ncbi:NUDIX domain-containing protein [Fictibacillus nanhaiensis]|uniref:NUDIX hydrolase n=1 Tax=Fictibacillus nanhaiensis TaxID=742169 RepID=UPI001C97F185|nr:NUDIX domain-containing protein [Fictibacillus nanhaiensis]MBY6036493.1 NUDIX domain-containing protein [Fictibacillus nanhaiensis]
MFVVNVEAAVYQRDCWLIIQRSLKEEHAAGELSLVGGQVEDEGNSSDILERTAIREVFEEVGVKVKGTPQYVHSTSFISNSGKKVVDIVFLVEYDSGEAYPKSENEVENVFWLTTEEIMSHPETNEIVRESIRRADLIIKQYV